MTDPYDTLIGAIDEGVCTVTLNRPDKYKCFKNAMIRDFHRLWSAEREDDAVRAIVPRAAPGKAFCTGVDVREGWRPAGSRPGPFDYDDPGDWLGPKTNRVWKPFVVAVHGMAAGGAFYLLNKADIVICSDEAQFFDPHLKLGKLSAVEPVGALGRMPVSGDRAHGPARRRGTDRCRDGAANQLGHRSDDARHALAPRRRDHRQHRAPRAGADLRQGPRAVGGAEPAARTGGSQRGEICPGQQGERPRRSARHAEGGSPSPDTRR